MSIKRKRAWFVVSLLVTSFIIAGSNFFSISVSANGAKAPQQCVTVAGDSVAKGGAVYQIPDVGYTSVLTVSLATLMENQFKARNMDIRAFDRSVGAAGISSPQKKPFLRDWNYGQLIR